MLKIYIPKKEDYWYEQKLQNDPKTMNYNAGYDVSYFGYHYDTGCIDFPEEKWEDTYNRRLNENKFFAYLFDGDKKEFIGYINYHKSNNRYECGIVIEANKRGNGYATEGLKLLIEHAKNNGITELYDNFEKDRDAFRPFENVGFKIVEETKWIKFKKEVEGIIIKINL